MSFVVMAQNRTSLAGEEEMFEFEGFPPESPGERDELAGIKRQLMGLVRWRGVMESWRREIGAKVDSLTEICGAVSTDEKPVGDALEAVMAKVDELVAENAALRAQLKEYEDLNAKVNSIGEARNEWTKTESAKVIALEEIVKEQKEEREREKKQFADNVVHVLKEKEKVVRETIDRGKCIIVFGDVENHIKDIKARKKSDEEMVKKVIERLDNDNGWINELEEVQRLGKYTKDETRPLRVEFKSRSVAEAIVNVSWKLNATDMKHIRVKKDLSKDEREQIKVLQAKADAENEKMSEVEKKKFFWRVKEGQLRKWYLRNLQKKDSGEGEKEESPVRPVGDRETGVTQVTQEVVGGMQRGGMEERET